MKSAPDLRPGKHFDVAVFPMVNTVLFPGVTLPLHIFERRYEKMLQDIQAKEMPLAISLAVRQEETVDGYLLNSIGCAGPMQIFKKYADGRSDILIHGEQRIRLLSFLQQEPYYLMRAESLEPDTTIAPMKHRSFEEFQALIKAWAFLHPKVSDELSLFFDEFETFGEICDFFAYHFLKNAPEQQNFLNCINPMERAEMLASHLELELLRLGRRACKRDSTVVLH